MSDTQEELTIEDIKRAVEILNREEVKFMEKRIREEQINSIIKRYEQRTP